MSQLILCLIMCLVGRGASSKNKIIGVLAAYSISIPFTLGWTSRQQFEETWMCLLGVLNPVSINEIQPESTEVTLLYALPSHIMNLHPRSIPSVYQSLLLETLIKPCPCFA